MGRKWDRRRENKRKRQGIRSSKTLRCSLPINFVPIGSVYNPGEYEYSFDAFRVPKEMLEHSADDVKFVGSFVFPDGSEVRGRLEDLCVSSFKERPTIGFFWGDRIVINRSKR